MHGASDQGASVGFTLCNSQTIFYQIKFGPWRLVSHCRWIWYNDGRPLNRSAPINITLWGRSGAVRRASLMDLAEDQYDLGVQF